MIRWDLMNHSARYTPFLVNYWLWPSVPHFSPLPRITLALLALAAIASGCDTSLGVVGSAGLTDSGTFTGITDANVLSPTSVKVAWNTSSDYNTYSASSSFFLLALPAWKHHLLQLHHDGPHP